MRFLRDITLGQYIPADSIIHRLDPRTKFFILISLIISLFFFESLIKILLFALFLVLVIRSAKLSLYFILRGFRSFLWFFLFIIILHLFFTPGNPIFAPPFSFLNITYEGLSKGILISSRLFLLIISTSLLALTTSPMELVNGLEDILKPLAKIGIPVNDFSIMIMIVIRFIPILLDEANKIIKAQKARGADLENKNFMQKGKSLIAMFIPLFMRAFHRADELVTAMEARGYRRGKPRTRLKELKFKKIDGQAISIFLGWWLLIFII